MEQRIIKLSVKNEYILGEGVVIGAAGSHDEVLLELDFRASPVWHGTTKKAIFYDAMYKNPATILLTTNLLAAGQTDVYYVPVPQAAKTAAGDCFLTVEGTVVEGSGENAKETVRVTTKEARFPVLPNKRYLNETPITPTQAEQLQAEIDDIKSTVSEAKDSADAAAESKEKAATSEANAKASEEAAQTSAAAAAKIEETAKAAETQRAANETARVQAETARANAETQRQSNEAARQNAESQRVSAENARNVWEDYDVTKAYTVGNKVVYGGSSYLCIKPCTGIAPPNAEYWRLIAAKGNVTPANVTAAIGYTPARKDTVDAIVNDCLETATVPGENYNLLKAEYLIVKRRLVTGSTENVESSNYYNSVLKTVPVKYGKYYRITAKTANERTRLSIERINRVQKDGTVIADSYTEGNFYTRPASNAVFYVNDPDTVGVEIQMNSQTDIITFEVKYAADLIANEIMLVEGDSYDAVISRSLTLPYLNEDEPGKATVGYIVKPDATKTDKAYSTASRKMIHKLRAYDPDYLPNDRFVRAISGLRDVTAKDFTLTVANTTGTTIKNAAVAIGLHNTVGVIPANNNAPFQIYDDVFSTPTGIKFWDGETELPYYIESESDCNYYLDRTIKTDQKTLAVFPDGKIAVWNGTAARMRLTADDGATWTNICTNITSMPYRILLPDSQGNLFVASADGKYLYKYTAADGYQSGTTVIDMSALDTQIGSILAEDSEGNLYIGTYQSAPWHCVIRKSTDHGDTWAIVFDTTNSQHVHNIYINRKVTPNEIFIGLDNNTGYVETYLSTDAGTTWTKISENIPYRNCDYAFRYAGEHFYIGCGERNILGGAALYKTTDYNDPDAYYTLFDNGQGIRDVTNVIDGSDDVLIAGGCVGDPVMAEQLFLSEDKGETWRTVYYRPWLTKQGIAGFGLRTFSRKGSQILTSAYDDYTLRFSYGGGAKTILAIVSVGDIPPGGKTITLKTGYAASLEQMDEVLTAYEHIDGKVADIRITDGAVVDTVSGKRVLTDKTEYVEANTRLGQTPEDKVLSTASYRLRDSVNLGKLSRLNFSKGFTVSMLFRKEDGKNYLEDGVIHPIFQSGSTKFCLWYRSLVLMSGDTNIYARKLYLDDAYLNSVNPNYVRLTAYFTADNLPVANVYTSNSFLAQDVECTSYPITENLSANDFLVGDSAAGAPNIARIEIYNRVLTHAEIMSLTTGCNFALGNAAYTAAAGSGVVQDVLNALPKYDGGVI